MESKQQFYAFLTMAGIVVLVIVVALASAILKVLNGEMIAFLGGITTGAFAMLQRPQSRSVTIDNKPNDPVPVERKGDV